MTEPAAGEPGATGDQDAAEALDEDVLRSEPDYTGDAPLEYPPERPTGSLSRAITPLDELVGESLAERAAREEPDLSLELLGEEPPVSDVVDRVILLVDPDADVAGEPSYADAEGDEVAGDAEGLGDEGAEEAAVHLTEDPPWRSSDGYVDEP